MNILLLIKWNYVDVMRLSLCHTGYTGEPGTQNEETRNFFKHTLLQHGTYTKDVRTFRLDKDTGSTEDL